MPSIPTFSLVLGGALLSLVGVAQAQVSPRSVSECERLKNDLAFNQCLSMFGPPAKNVAGGEAGTTGTAVTALPPAMAAAPAVEEPARQVSRGRRHRRGSYTRGGRKSASFAVTGDSKSYRRHRRRR